MGPDRPCCPSPPRPAPDRADQHRVLGGVLPGRADPGHRQRGQDGAAVGPDRPRRPPRHSLTGSTNGVGPMAFSPDGRTLVAGGLTGRPALGSDRTNRSAPPAGQPLTGRGTCGTVFSVAFSPDGTPWPPPARTRRAAVGPDRQRAPRRMGPPPSRQWLWWHSRRTGTSWPLQRQRPDHGVQLWDVTDRDAPPYWPAADRREELKDRGVLP